MKGLGKKLVALVAAAALTVTALVGCAGVDDSEIAAKVGDSEITAGMFNFYARFQQPAYEEYYISYMDYQQQMQLGSVMYETEMDWNQEQEEGVTMAEAYKQDIMTTLQNFLILEDHMDEYDVTLSEDELAAIDAAATAFDEANAEEVKEKVSADKETVKEVLRLITISEKMYQAIIAEADTEVSDEEAAQKKMQYMYFTTTKTAEDGTTSEMTEEEVAAVKADAVSFLEGAKNNGSLEAYATQTEVESSSLTFDAESTAPSEEVIKAADALGENEFSEVIETDSGFYVLQLTSLLDREATDAEKETIVSERQSEKYTETLEAWTEETEITVYDDVIKKIDLQGLEVTAKEVEEETDTTEDADTTESTDTTEDADTTDTTESTDTTDTTESTDTTDTTETVEDESTTEE